MGELPLELLFLMISSFDLFPSQEHAPMESQTPILHSVPMTSSFAILLHFPLYNGDVRMETYGGDDRVPPFPLAIS